MVVKKVKSKVSIKKVTGNNYLKIVGIVGAIVVAIIILMFVLYEAAYYVGGYSCSLGGLSPALEKYTIEDGGIVLYSHNTLGVKDTKDLSWESVVSDYLTRNGYSQKDIDLQIQSLKKEIATQESFIITDYDGGVTASGTGDCTRDYSSYLVDLYDNPLYKCVKRDNHCPNGRCLTVFGRDEVSSSRVNWCKCL